MKLKIVTERNTYIFSEVVHVEKDNQYLHVNNKGDKKEHIFAIRDIKQIFVA